MNALYGRRDQVHDRAMSDSGDRHPQPESMDPDAVVQALSDVLDRAELAPPIRYALSVVLLAQEIRDTYQGPFPERLQHLIRETLIELQRLRSEPDSTSILELRSR